MILSIVTAVVNTNDKVIIESSEIIDFVFILNICYVAYVEIVLDVHTVIAYIQIDSRCFVHGSQLLHSIGRTECRFMRLSHLEKSVLNGKFIMERIR